MSKTIQLTVEEAKLVQRWYWLLEDNWGMDADEEALLLKVQEFVRGLET